MLPSVAIVDPELTWGLPPGVTAHTGIDALTQVIEPYVCLRANAMTDGFCVEGMRRAARSLRIMRLKTAGQAAARERTWRWRVCSEGWRWPIPVWEPVAWIRKGALGGMIPAPHGAICAALLPHVMAANVRAMREREPRHEALRRYEEVGRLITGRATASAEDGVEWVKELVKDLGIRGLGSYGLAQGEFGEVMEKGAKANSMKANPIVLTAEEQREILGRR